MIRQVVYKEHLYITGKMSDVLVYLKELEEEFQTIGQFMAAAKGTLVEDEKKNL
jgi:hypothetical protein